MRAGGPLDTRDLDAVRRRPLVAAASTARSSVVVATSLLLSSLLGGLLALLISVIVGEGPEADGFLAAYSVYLVFILFGSTLRVALVPLFGPTRRGGFRRAAAARADAARASRRWSRRCCRRLAAGRARRWCRRGGAEAQDTAA